MSRDIRIEFRVKNARLLDAIEQRWGGIIDQVWAAKKGNHKSGRPLVAESASLAQVSPSAMGNLLKMSTPAYRKKTGEPTTPARMIAEALDETVEYLFPPRLCSVNIPVTHAYLSEETFLSLSDVSDREAITPGPDEQEESDLDRVNRLLSLVSPRHANILRARFGLEGKPQTLRRIAEREDVTSSTIRQMEQRAMSKIRAVAFKRKSS